MSSKSTIFKVIFFLLFVLLPWPSFGETEYFKEMNKCKYAFEVCYKECLRKDVDAKTKPSKSKVEECLRECDFYDDLCKRIAMKLYKTK